VSDELLGAIVGGLLVVVGGAAVAIIQGRARGDAVASALYEARLRAFEEILVVCQRYDDAAQGWGFSMGWRKDAREKAEADGSGVHVVGQSSDDEDPQEAAAGDAREEVARCFGRFKGILPMVVLEKLSAVWWTWRALEEAAYLPKEELEPMAGFAAYGCVRAAINELTHAIRNSAHVDKLDARLTDLAAPLTLAEWQARVEAEEERAPRDADITEVGS
jgi:hypothetical protein